MAERRCIEYTFGIKAFPMSRAIKNFQDMDRLNWTREKFCGELPANKTLLRGNKSDAEMGHTCSKWT
jgi:hypothetical protein